MHILSWLAVNGTAAIVEFPGVLYRGGAEQKIRKYLIDNNYVDTVIQLPPDLFFGTTIATCIIVLKKSKTDNASCSSTRPPSSSARQQEQAHPSEPAEDPRCFHRARGRRPLRALVDRTPRSQRTATTSPCPPTSSRRTRAKRSTSPSSTPRSPGSSRDSPSCAPQIDAIVADLEGGADVSKIDDLITELCPGRGRVQDAWRGRRVHSRQRSPEEETSSTTESAASTTARSTRSTARPRRRRIVRVAQHCAISFARRSPGDVVIADDERERRGRLQGGRWLGERRSRSA